MVRAPLSLLLALRVASLPASVHAQTPVAPAELNPAEKARALYAARRYVEAARAYEAVGTPEALYNAGMARKAAGHHAHVIHHWQRYLDVATEVPAEERAEIQREIAEEQAQAVGVRFVADASPTPRTLVLRAEARPSDDGLKILWSAEKTQLSVYLDAGDWTATLQSDVGATPAISVPVRTGETPEISLEAAAAPEPEAATTAPVRLRLGPDAALGQGVDVAWTGPGIAPTPQRLQEKTADWELSPGTWTLKATARGYEPVERIVDVSGPPVDVELVLRRDRMTRVRLGMSIGFGVAAVGALVGGGILFARGKSQGKELLDQFDGRVIETSYDSSDAFLDASGRQATGAILMASGGGATIVAATVAGGGRERVLGVEAGVGALLMAVGIPLFIRSRSCWEDLGGDSMFEATAAELEGCATREMPGAVLAGLGIGTLAASGTALIVRRALRGKTSKTRAAVGGGPTGAYLFIQGRF